MTAIAPSRAYFAYPSAPAHKLLLPQREAQFDQSARTRDGKVADYAPPEPNTMDWERVRRQWR